MIDPQFDVQPHLEWLYRQDRRLEYRATTPPEHRQWQRQLHERLLVLLGLAGRQRPAVSVRHIYAADRGAFREEKYALDVGEELSAPMYVLVPKAPPPYKALLAFHGHVPSVHYMLGNFPDAPTETDWLKRDGAYAAAMAKAGYLVCAVEQRGFGERRSRDAVNVTERVNSCRHQNFAYMMMGRNLIGERCWDGMCAIDYLETRDDIVPGPLAATGNSGGGQTTLWLSAIEERITVSIPSCYFCSFKASVLDLWHCECNYVPGILLWAEMGELGAMIAPRPLRVIAGQQDDIFPIAAVREQAKTVEQAYRTLGVADKFSLAVHGGPHAYSNAMALEWLKQWL